MDRRAINAIFGRQWVIDDVEGFGASVATRLDELNGLGFSDELIAACRGVVSDQSRQEMQKAVGGTAKGKVAHLRKEAYSVLTAHLAPCRGFMLDLGDEVGFPTVNLTSAQLAEFWGFSDVNNCWPLKLVLKALTKNGDLSKWPGAESLPLPLFGWEARTAYENLSEGKQAVINVNTMPFKFLLDKRYPPTGGTEPRWTLSQVAERFNVTRAAAHLWEKDLLKTLGVTSRRARTTWPPDVVRAWTRWYISSQ